MILSICIPSYNRLGELKKLLDSIAESKSDKFDVLVVDNKSVENVCEIGEYDKRFKFIKRETAIPGPVSIRSSIDYGDGDFIMLCLDKDFISGKHLRKFIDELEKNKEITCGYCKLNSVIECGTIQINNSKIEKRIYRCGHPSGYFFRRDIIEKATKNTNPFNKESPFYNNPFLIDLAYAHGLVDGKEGIYNGILVVPETAEKASTIKSYTYTTENKNIYFMPECRSAQMFLLFKHLAGLKLGNREKARIMRHLFRRTMYDCTIGYKYIMSNKQICSHHSIACRHITVRQIIKEAWILSIEFKRFKTNDFPYFFKFETIVYSWIVLLIRMLIKNR